MSEDNEQPSRGEHRAQEQDDDDATADATKPPDNREDGDDLRRLNALSKEEATAALLKCCGSQNWVRLVAARRPFRDARELFETTDRVWWSLSRVDWMEAFSTHPKIGERRAEKGADAEARRWSEEEQSSTLAAAPETLAALADANRVYEQRFGFIYIVCAAGKSTGEMLALLEHRLGNDSDTELCVAAEEQRRITQLRLRKLLKL